VIFQDREGYLKAFNEDKHIVRGKQIHLRQTHTRKEMKNKRIKSDIGDEEQPQFNNFGPYYFGTGRDLHSDLNLPPSYGRGGHPPQEPFFKSAYHIRKPDYFENEKDHYYQANSEYGQNPVGFTPMGYGFKSEQEIPMHPPQGYRQRSNKNIGQNPNDWQRGYPQPLPHHQQQFRPNHRPGRAPGLFPPNERYQHPQEWPKGHPQGRNGHGYNQYPPNYGQRGHYHPKGQVPVNVNREFYSERKLYPPRMGRNGQGHLAPGHQQGSFKGVKSFNSEMNIGMRGRGHQNWIPAKRNGYNSGYQVNHPQGGVPYGSMRDMSSGANQNFSNPHSQNVFMEGDEEEDSTLQRANVPF